ncbi:MAG: hypothetical protein HKN60_05970 [Rhizobiales bacterium]|nr:hypothetical protein [Hyphomicrobiales bacterium]
MLESIELQRAIVLALGFGTLAAATLLASVSLAGAGPRADGARHPAQATARPPRRALPPELLSL